jgi:hypothetical protein
MAARTKSGTGFDPAAVEAVEWLARRDLGAPVPGSGPASVADEWRGGGFGDEGHCRRFLRDPHPPRFRRPGGVEVAAVGPEDDAESFGATAAFGLRAPARAGSTFASLPGNAGWRCYVAHAGSAPPAAAATFAAGPIVLLAVDATVEAGGRSAARAALLHRVLSDAIEADARVIGARVDEADASRKDAAAGLLLAGFKAAYLCPAWVDARLPAG